MLSVGLISWWYGAGWKGQWSRVVGRWSKTLKFFSIGQLLATLFAPYRQISADGGSGNVFQVMFDKLLSRFIGAFIRSVTIIFGLLVITVQIIVETVITMFWLFLPILPIAGLVLFATGWVPSW